jgi:hypothetical protein
MMMVRTALATLPLLVLLLVAPATARAAEAEGQWLSIQLGHPFSQEDARNRMQLLLQYWSGRFGVKSEWQGFVASVEGKTMGIPIRAKLEVRQGEVMARVSDPGFAVRGIGMDYVRRKVRKYLHPTYEES